MGKKSKPPPGPNWKEVLEMTKEYQTRSLGMMEEYMDFQESAYADQQALQDQILDVQLPAMQDEAALSQQLRDRYRDAGIPFEDEYLDKITNWDSETRRDERAGAAQAGISQAAEAQREAQIRQLESYGIDPSQTRSAALDSTLRLQEAVAKAGAGNAERQKVEQEGLGLGADAVNLYRGMPSMSQASLNTATGAGQTAFGNQGQLGQFGGQGYMNAANMNNQAFQQGAQGYNTAGNLHQNDLRAYEMNAQYGPGAAMGNLFGTALGAAGAAGSGGATLFGSFFGEGGAVPHYAEGGGAPQGGGAQPSAAPQGGPQGSAGQTPAAMPRPQSQGIPPENQMAMLSPGEFVIPDDVARWEGEKNLQKIINKAREDRVNTESQRAQNQQSLGIPA